MNYFSVFKELISDVRAAKMTPVKQTQLRNFLSKRQMPPVRSTAPGTSSHLCVPQSFVFLMCDGT